jgi:imidazolonepropionase-like amidohydrolase
MFMKNQIEKRAERSSLLSQIMVAILLVVAAVPAAYSGEMFVAIKGGTVLTMAGTSYDDGIVLIRNGKIAAVGRNVRIPEGATIVDARGKYVMPGVIDAMTYFGIRPFAPNVPEPVSPDNRIVDAYRPFGELMKGPGGVQPEDELLCGGITTIYIAPGSGQLISGQGAVVKTDGRDFDGMVLRESASVDMALAYVPPGGAGASVLPSRMSLMSLLRKTLVAAREYKKSIEDFAKKRKKEKDKAVGPSRDLGNEALARLLDGEIPARVEADLPEDILNAVQLAEEFHLALVIDSGIGAHKVRNILAKRKIPVVLGPISHPMEAIRKNDLMEIQAMEDERLAAWLTEAGVKVAISSHSSDNKGSGKATQGRWLLLEAALATGFGLSEEDALKAVTINAAEILGVADRVGSLEPGKDADIVILSGYPLKVETQVDQVFIDGRISYTRENREGI